MEPCEQQYVRACFNVQVEVLFDEILKLLSDDAIEATKSVQEVFAHSSYRPNAFVGWNAM